MTYRQRKLIEWMEQAVLQFHSSGYTELACKASQVVDALRRNEPVWAVILAASYGLGPAFVDRLRLAFRVGRIE